MERDEKGRFQKGNQVGRLPPDIRMMKTAIREELVQCAYSLLRPWQTLKEETKKEGMSRYQFIVNKAVAEGNIKLITWITEMAVGRPKHHEMDRTDNGGVVYIPFNKDQQEDLVKLAMRAREAKIVEERGQTNEGNT